MDFENTKYNNFFSLAKRKAEEGKNLDNDFMIFLLQKSLWPGAEAPGQRSFCGK